MVSTPQDLALKDAVRGLGMFKKVDVPVGSATFVGIFHPFHTLSLIPLRV